MQLLVENMVAYPNILIRFLMVIQRQIQFHVLQKDLIKVFFSILISLILMLEHLSVIQV